MALAETLATRSMQLSAGDLLHPYILNYELLFFAGKPAEAEAQRQQIDKLLDAKLAMNAETKDYIRFTLLTLTPDAFLLGQFPSGITDPANNLGAVLKTYKLWWPYSSPRMAVKRLLTVSMSTATISSQI